MDYNILYILQLWSEPFFVTSENVIKRCKCHCVTRNL